MHAESIDLRAAPGIARPLVLSGLGPSLILLVGPNGSGKSTLGRVLRWSLWPREASELVQATILWRLQPAEPSLPSMLFAGTVRWPDGAPRIPAEASGAWSMNVRSLLTKHDDDIARLIETALSGGFDLPAARRTVAGKGHPPRKALGDLGEASDALRGALDEADALARKATELDRLRAEVQEAADAYAEKGLAEAALELAKARGLLKSAEEALAALPPGLERLRVGIDADIEVARAEYASTVAGLALLRADEKDLGASIATLEFPLEEPEHVVIAAQRGRADELQACEAELRARGADLEGAKAGFREARRAILSDPDRVQTLGPDAIDALDRALSEARTAQAEVGAAERLLRDLPAVPASGDLAALGESARTLRRWLRAPPVPVEPEAPPRPWFRHPLGLGGLVGLLLSLAAGATLAVMQGALSTALALVIGLGLGLVLAAVGALAWLTASGGEGDAPPPPPDLRGQVEASWPSEAQVRPESWTPDAVQACLDRTEKAEALARTAALHEEQLRLATGRLDSARARERTARAAVSAVLSEWGLAPGLAETTLAVRARRIHAASAASAQEEQARAARDAVQQQVASRLDALEGWLGGLMPGMSVSAGPGAKAAVEGVFEQLSNLLEARKDLARTEKAASREQGRATVQQQKLQRLWSQVGLAEGEEDALRQRLACLDAWVEHQDASKQAGLTIARLQTQLEDRPGHLDLSAPAAEQLIEEQRELAAALAERQARVSDLEKEIRDASHGDTIQTRTAALEAARGTLAQHRDEDARKAVGRALLDWVDGTVSRDNTPPVLERARRRFLQFTQGRYRLEVSGASFGALDTESQRHQPLDQLSDATRIQLLLATRLAYLEQAEADGPKLPLFLDEVLSTSDPARFEQVGRCLLQLVREGRQVFYATAVPAEVALWRGLCDALGAPMPQVCGLAEAAERRGWPPDLPVASAVRGPAPDPAGQSAEAYARALGLRGVAPRPVDARRPAGGRVLLDRGSRAGRALCPAQGESTSPAALRGAGRAGGGPHRPAGGGARSATHGPRRGRDLAGRRSQRGGHGCATGRARGLPRAPRGRRSRLRGRRPTDPSYEREEGRSAGSAPARRGVHREPTGAGPRGARRARPQAGRGPRRGRNAVGWRHPALRAVGGRGAVGVRGGCGALRSR